MGNTYCKECWKNQPEQLSQPVHFKIISKQSPILKPMLTHSIQYHLNEHQPYPHFKRLSHGRVVTKLPHSENIYEGPINQNSQPHGYGKIYFVNGSVFQGEFANGVVNGNGHYIFINGDCIYGDLVDGILTKGVYTCGDGINRYEGEFLKTDFHGKGQQIGNGYCFQGLYNKGLRVQGIFKFNPQIKQNQGFKYQSNKRSWEMAEPLSYQFEYQGKFNQQAKFQGKATLKGPKGIYIGQFQNGKKHGTGQFHYRQGSKYVGQYSQNKKQGSGTIYTNNKMILYCGKWKNDLPHGQGYKMNEFGDRINIVCDEGVEMPQKKVEKGQQKQK